MMHFSQQANDYALPLHHSRVELNRHTLLTLSAQCRSMRATNRASQGSR